MLPLLTLAAAEVTGMKRPFCAQSIYQQATLQTANRITSDPSLILYGLVAEGLEFLSLQTKQIQKLIDSCVHQTSE